MNDTYDPINPRTLAQAQRQAEDDTKRKRIQRSSDVKQLMSVGWGRRLMWGLLEDAKTYQSTFNTNAMTMARDEGRRSFGLELLAHVQATCPEQYIVMLREGAKRQTRKDEE